MKQQKIIFILTLIGCITISGCFKTIPQEYNNIQNDGINNEQNKESKEINNIEKKIKNIEYENKKYNFKIQIPYTRTFQEDINGFNIEIKTPKNDNINENLGIVVQELQTDETLKSFTERTEKGLKELYANYNEIKKESIKIDGTEGTSIIYEVSENGYEIKAQQTVFLKNNKSYILQYTATKETFDNYINEITEIINSFTLLN